MFQIISILAYLILFIGIAIHYSLHRRSSAECKPSFLNQDSEPTSPVLLSKIKTGTYFVGLISFFLLALTGFGAAALWGQSLTGFALIIHTAAAPFFAVCIVKLVILWANKFCFTASDWRQKQYLFTRNTNSTNNQHPPIGPGQKILFWLIAFLSLPTFLSIVLCMFPIFGTEGQTALVQCHHNSALLLSLAIITHIYLSILKKRQTDSNE